MCSNEKIGNSARNNSHRTEMPMARTRLAAAEMQPSYLVSFVEVGEIPGAVSTYN